MPNVCELGDALILSAGKYSICMEMATFIFIRPFWCAWYLWNQLARYQLNSTVAQREVQWPYFPVLWSGFLRHRNFCDCFRDTFAKLSRKKRRQIFEKCSSPEWGLEVQFQTFTIAKFPTSRDDFETTMAILIWPLDQLPYLSIYIYTYLYTHIVLICIYIYYTIMCNIICTLQTPRLPASDPAYPLTCSNPFVGLAFFYFPKTENPKTLKA